MTGPDSGERCVFPFKLNGISHTECTMQYAHLKNGKPWCSTKVDEDGEHIGKQGGNSIDFLSARVLPPKFSPVLARVSN